MRYISPQVEKCLPTCKASWIWTSLLSLYIMKSVDTFSDTHIFRRFRKPLVCNTTFHNLLLKCYQYLANGRVTPCHFLKNLFFNTFKRQFSCIEHKFRVILCNFHSNWALHVSFWRKCNYSPISVLPIFS